MGETAGLLDEQVDGLRGFARRAGRHGWQTPRVVASRIERIDVDRHDRSGFCSGDRLLDGWLRHEAVAAGHQSGVVVRVVTHDGMVVGCYRLGVFRIEAETTPVAGSSARNPVPAMLISWLGVDQRWQLRDSVRR